MYVGSWPTDMDGVNNGQDSVCVSCRTSLDSVVFLGFDGNRMLLCLHNV